MAGARLARPTAATPATTSPLCRTALGCDVSGARSASAKGAATVAAATVAVVALDLAQGALGVANSTTHAEKLPIVGAAQSEGPAGATGSRRSAKPAKYLGSSFVALNGGSWEKAKQLSALSSGVQANVVAFQEPRLVGDHRVQAMEW